MSRMADRRQDLRPREKLRERGAKSLSEYELLMAIIGSGTSQADVTKVARDVKRVIESKQGHLLYDDLLAIKGFGAAKATQFMAGYELWRRHFELDERPIVTSVDVAARQLNFIRTKRQEYFVCLTLDGAGRLISKRTITIGTLTASLVHPREVFAEAIVDRAASIIVAHNHPSGNLEPSQADRDVTLRLQQSGELLGIRLIDHLIVTKNSHKSIIE